MIIDISDAEGINPFPTKKYDASNLIEKFKACASGIVGNAFMHSAKKTFGNLYFTTTLFVKIMTTE